MISKSPSKNTVQVMICNGIDDHPETRSDKKTGYPLFFATGKRCYSLIEPSGGYAQSMQAYVLAASIADVAVILVDARKGLFPQTRLYSHVAAMLGIRHVILAVGGMEREDFDESLFNAVAADFHAFAADLGFSDTLAMPVPGLHINDLLCTRNTVSWYTGPGLTAYLDTLDVIGEQPQNAFRMPVYWVNRSDPHDHGYCGPVIAGMIHAGDSVRVLPSGLQAHVKTLTKDSNEVASAHAGDTVTLTLDDGIAVNCGDMLAAADDPPEVADQFEASLFWISENAMIPGRQYLMKLDCREVTATMTGIKYRQDIDTGAQLAARTLRLHETGRVSLSTSAPLIFARSGLNRALGGFLLIDRLTRETAGAGMLEFALRRAANIHWQALELNKATRSALKKQTPKCIWFTGLSGSGKSTIANLLEKRLHQTGRHTYLLDGDNVRHGLSRDLGFTEADRVENIRRVSEVARLMVDAGLIVLVSFISPFRSERRMARELFAEGEFIEVFVDTPLAECERRDVKGLYAKVRSGDLKNFTGIDSPYEPPQSPEVRIQTTLLSPDAGVERILKLLR